MPSRLDYVFTDEEGLINDVDYLSPLGKSDHVIFSDHIDYTISRYRSRIRPAYDIVAAIYRTITISCTNARLVRALLTYRSICV